MTDLTAKIFHDERAAREHLENLRWPDGPVCPHCGEFESIRKLKGKSHRPGLYKCRSCRKPFTVTVGTLFERSKIPLHKWVLATHLLCSSKKGISSHQLHRTLGVTYKTAWFMTHRIREAMRETDPDPLGGKDKYVEADETYITSQKWVFHNEKGWLRKPKIGNEKDKVFALVERDGKARSFHVERVNARTVRNIMVREVDRDSNLMTDDATFYRKPGREFARHEVVNHTLDEYVRGDAGTQVIENYFSIFKRGLTGIYQHVGSKHLKRYLCEFDFRYNTRKINDHERASEALKGIEGKRMTYRRIGERRVA